MRREVVEHHPHGLGIGIMHIDQFTHAVGEVMGCFTFGHLHVSSRLMGIEKDEEVGGAVAPIFVVDTGGLARLGRPLRYRGGKGGARIIYYCDKVVPLFLYVKASREDVPVNEIRDALKVAHLL